jgi:2-C-methyl-D-erythritol 2,4-cyclodiphosphate synthase
VSGFRVGSGFDAHRLVPGRALVLGGVRIDHSLGLEGHSDGDCLTHALCDALLGAIAAGDLGQRFPSNDPRWRDASSLLFLEETARRVREEGLRIENVDLTVIAEAPRLAPHAGAMRDCLSRALNLDPRAISIKAKSTDGLGFLGRGEGIAAQAVVLLATPEGVGSSASRISEPGP